MLIGILVVAVGGLVGMFVLANSGASNTPVGDKTKIIRDTSHKEGSGAVQVVEYGDYQCPACGVVYPNLKQLMKDYDGKVTFYFRNFPLTSLHPNANASANAAEAAANQNKFWEMHDKLYETQKDWSDLASNDADAKFAGYAKELGLDVDKFKKALADKQFQSVIDQDTADANAMGVNSTPTVYINGVKTSKNDYASLRDTVEAQLNKK